MTLNFVHSYRKVRTTHAHVITEHKRLFFQDCGQDTAERQFLLPYSFSGAKNTSKTRGRLYDFEYAVHPKVYRMDMLNIMDDSFDEFQLSNSYKMILICNE
ncbi:uncharacterized protein [Mycetomoellerius zeteki]|uniref:uncharacterized protein n=1 Tax=Mycetomoellerius zeteki TaxID=64791 RepID=UPI00084EB022|nr:PREDICTED: uncharacterized protein LOC108726567 [Trachymyrmex zeteki]